MTDAFLEQLTQQRLLPVIRTESPDLAHWAATVLIEQGVQVLEITDTVPKSNQVIATLKQQFPQVTIGAGTVLSVDAAQRLHEAGAQFLVSPVTNPAVVTYGNQHALPVIPGALTPTEVMTAHQLGAPVVKVFPIQQLGGAEYLKTLTTLMPAIPLIPTGGVSPETVAPLLAAGALALGLGQHLFPQDALTNRDPQPILKRWQAYQAALPPSV
jgi:2-dehydro-3-deoxyphosphogluconate aldolase/(4S)-4-hydroxy-2-oxoglutarate aldolase